MFVLLYFNKKNEKIIDPEGWDGEGGGSGVQDGEHMYTRGRFMSIYGETIQYCKVISLQ